VPGIRAMRATGHQSPPLGGATPCPETNATGTITRAATTVKPSWYDTDPTSVRARLLTT